MNNEIMNVFRTVLKEELEPVQKRLGVIKQDIAKLEQDMKELKKGQNRLEQDVKELKTEQIEGHKNVIRHLVDYSEKITEHFDNKTDALNKLVFTVETEIERLIKQ